MKNDWRKVEASSFADPADVRRFKNAKARGLSDVEAFKYGDNGIGAWGADTTAPRPMVALPPEEWSQIGKNPAGAKVIVRRGAREIVAELQDTMPRIRYIRNGARIDLNPTACVMLGISIPAEAQVEWKWREESPAVDLIENRGGITIAQLAGVVWAAIIGPFKSKK